MRRIQETNKTLSTVPELVYKPSRPFCVEDGLLYLKWVPLSQQEVVMQLVLPKQCRPMWGVISVKIRYLVIGVHLVTEYTLSHNRDRLHDREYTV